MKKLLVVASLMALTLNMAKGQNIQESEQIFVRVYEYYGGYILKSKVIISYSEGKTETINLEPRNEKNGESNAEKINATLNKIRKAGYKLITSNGGEYNSSYLFVKEE